MLPASDSLFTAYCTKYYALVFSATIILTVGINAIVDYYMDRHHAPWYLMDKNTTPTVYLFTVLVGFFTFWGSSDIHNRIRKESLRPVTAEALRSNLFLRVVLFPIGMANWKRRFWFWMLWLVCLATVMMIAIVLVCWICVGFGKVEKTSVECSLTEKLLFKELWKGLVAASISLANTAAAHNVEQPELHKVDEGANAKLLHANDGEPVEGVVSKDLYESPV